LHQVKRRYFRIASLLAVIAAAGILWYTSRPKPVDVVVSTAELGLVEKTVANTRAGTVEACERAYPTPSLGGQISRLAVTEGQKVKEGDLLLELWNKDVKAEVALARSEVEAAKSRARASCLTAEVAVREADRLVTLQERGVASEEQTDKAVTESKARKAECAAARTNIEVADSKLGVAEAKLARTRLSAPFDGVVAEVNGELSQYVTPSPPGIATLPIIDLIGIGCFYVSAPIDEVDVPGIEPGMPARITLDAYGDRIFEGRVKRIAPYVLALEKQARTVDIEAEFVLEEDIKRLLAGYSADVEVILVVHDPVLRIPTEALVEGKRVFVLDAAGVLTEREVQVGLANWDYTEVLSGLEVGDLVVTSVDRDGVEDGAPARMEIPAP
jgi:HlyD family secretion protein